MRNILISFIIPAHNAAKTLSDCVKSIIMCGDKEIEILIIENGSEDETYAIAKKLSFKDDRIKISQSESGVSYARNKGIELATGKWLFFLDADDLIAEDKINCIVEDARKSKSDIVMYGHYVGKKRHNVTAHYQIFSDQDIEIFRRFMLENPTKFMQVWAKLIRKEIINKNHVLFDPKLKLAEDGDFILRLTKYCRQITLSEDNVYRYSVLPQSTIRSKNGEKTKGYIQSLSTGSQYVKQYEDIDLQHAFNKYIMIHLNILMVRDIFNIQNKNKYIYKYNKMKEIIGFSVFKDAIRKLHFDECISFNFMPTLCLKLRLYHCASLLFMIRAYQNHIIEKNINTEANYV